MTDDIRFKAVRAINVLASKNTMEVRSLMKASGLFELRDGFLLELLGSEVHTADSTQLLQQINLEALAGSARFREARTMETLVTVIVDTKDAEQRRGILAIFQKQVCKSPENLKYLSKMVDDPTLAILLSGKSLEELDSYLDQNRTKAKGLEKAVKVAGTQKADRMKQQLRSSQDRSARRNKVFADIAKDKAAVQSVLADYNVSAHTR